MKRENTNLDDENLLLKKFDHRHNETQSLLIEVSYTDYCISNRNVVLFLLWLGLVFCYIQRVALSMAIIPLSIKEKWEEDTEGLVLSSFYWGYILMQMPGGWLANRFGGKLVMTTSVVGSSLFTLILPFCSSDIYLLISCRVLTGFFEGTIYPVTYHYLGLWFPESEKGMASGVIGTAAPVGIIIAFISSAEIIEQLGWESIFWITGGAGLIWSCIWIITSRNYPGDRETISCMKMTLTEEALIMSNKMTYNGNSGENTSEVPWMPIFTNLAVQAFALNLFAYNWVKYITISWVPIYLSRDLGFELDSTGIFSVLPYLVASILTFASGKVADKIISGKYFTTVTVRKFFQFLGLVIPSIGLIVLSVVTTPPTETVIIMIAAVGATGFTGGGFIPNAVDLSSSYSGIIYAYGNTLGNIPGFVGVYITGEILKLTDHNWAVVWLLATAINGVSLVICILFFRGDEIDFKSQKGKCCTT